MAFSGGGQAITRPHTHNSGILQDGGSLRMDGITQGNMSAGSITQSDGNNLTELLIGTPTQVPRVNGAGTALEYHSPVDLTGSLELLGSETLVATSANLELSGTWNISDYTAFIVTLGMSNDNSAGTPTVNFRINNSSAAVYVTNMTLNTAGVLSASTSGMQTSGLICTSNVCNPSSTETTQTTLTLQLSEQSPANTFRWNWSNTPMWSQSGVTPSDTEQITGIFNNNFQTQLIKLDLFFSDGSNFRIGSNLYLYGVKRA
jgi:hypothetical protein